MHHLSGPRPIVSTLLPAADAPQRLLSWGNRQTIMSLIVIYIISIFVGDLVAVGIAEVIERFSDKAGLVVFLALYFLVFWVAWQFAVRITEPKASAPH